MAELTVTGLRALREVIALGSFSAAAERLGYTQSTISRQIAVIEAVAGGRVFERTNRGVRATELGLVVARHARAVLERLATAEHELADRSGEPRRRVRLGAFTSAMAALVPAVLARLPELSPRLTVTLHEGTSPVQLRRLASGALDVAVVTGDLERTMREHPGVGVEWLTADPLLLAVGPGHPLAAAASVAPAELEHERWIVGSATGSDGLLGAWTSASWTPRVVHTVKDWTAKLGLVAHGHGITLVPGLSAVSVPASVRLLRIDHPRAVRQVLLARPASATTRDPAQQVVRMLRRTLDGVAVPPGVDGVRPGPSPRARSAGEP